MKKYLYGELNLLGGFFPSVTCVDFKPDDYKALMSQLAYNLDDKVLSKWLETDVFCLGELDNITGVIVPCNDFVCHLSEFAEVVFKARGVKNGQVTESV